MTASSGNLEYETCDSYSNSEQALLQLHTPQMILSETEKKKKKGQILFCFSSFGKIKASLLRPARAQLTLLANRTCLSQNDAFIHSVAGNYGCCCYNCWYLPAKDC